MASSKRSALIENIQKVLKKHFKPVEAAKRSVFEHLLFACCLENSEHAAAEEAFQALRQQYFDWNEIRVSTTRELSEVVKKLNDPEDSAARLKQVIQSVFEALYSFELESLTKENIGQAAAKLQRFDGSTPFVVAYVTQQGLAGHAIPVNDGLLEAFHIVGIISDAEAANRAVPGLERAIPKSKGAEVGSILHNLGVLFARNPYSPAVRKLLLEIDPDCKGRLPKRPVKPPSKKETPAKKPTPPASSKKKAQPKKVSVAEKKASAAEKKVSAAEKKASATEKKTSATEKKASATEKKASAAEKKASAAEKKAPATEKKASATEKKAPAKKKPTPKKPTTKKPRAKGTKQPAGAKKKAQPTKKTTTKKSATKQLSKRKPR